MDGQLGTLEQSTKRAADSTAVGARAVLKKLSELRSIGQNDVEDLHEGTSFPDYVCVFRMGARTS